jgi:hypothetical protein
MSGNGSISSFLYNEYHGVPPVDKTDVVSRHTSSKNQNKEGSELATLDYKVNHPNLSSLTKVSLNKTASPSHNNGCKAIMQMDRHSQGCFTPPRSRIFSESKFMTPVDNSKKFETFNNRESLNNHSTSRFAERPDVHNLYAANSDYEPANTRNGKSTNTLLDEFTSARPVPFGKPPRKPED